MRDRLAPLPPTAETAVNLAERDRLPHREHEPEPAAGLEQSGAVAERDADLGAVDDVDLPEGILQPEIAVADNQGRQITDPSARQPVAHGADALDRQLETGVDVVRVRCRREDSDVEPVDEQLPGPQVPRVRGVTSEQNDAWTVHGMGRGSGPEVERFENLGGNGAQRERNGDERTAREGRFDDRR